MELWIRSQDKGKLIKVNSVYLPNPINANNFFPKIIANDGDYLGSYKTTKRALEVLDEIQNILRPKGFIKFNEQLSEEEIEKKKIEYFKNMYVDNAKLELIKMPSIWVYEMPKE